MKAYQIQTAAGIDGLKLVDLPEPKPEPGQILVRVLSVIAMINFSQITQ